MENTLEEKILRKKTTEYVGPFGTGKTTSLKKYFQDNQRFEPIWFNAYEFDYSGNPKVTFINEMVIGISKMTTIEKYKDKILKAFKLVERLLRGSMESFLKSHNIELAKKSDKDWAEAIANYQVESEKIKSLKSILNELASSIKKDVVIVIDDLDRARPDFALEIIEIAKHIFDVPNISIIFVYDLQAMNAITEKMYGKRTGERYLDKYIDNTFTHDDTSLFKSLDGYFLIIGFKMIVSPTARQLVNFDEKYDLEYESTNPIPFHGSRHDVPDSFLILKGALLAIKVKNPELLKIHEDIKNRKDLIFRNEFSEVISPIIKESFPVRESLNQNYLSVMRNYIENKGELPDVILDIIKYVNNLKIKNFI